MDDKKDLALGKLPIKQLKSASAVLSSLDLSLGQQEMNEIASRGKRND